MSPNTYTWTCARCGHTRQQASPAPPDHCPVCHYPDPPPPGWQGQRGDPAEVEAPLEREAEVAIPGTLFDEQPIGAALDPGRIAELYPPTTVGTGRVELGRGRALDRGWLAWVLERTDESVRAGLDDAGAGDQAPRPGEPAYYHEVARIVADLYEGERPTMLCGCLAGTHGDTIAAIEAAHPERRHG